MGDQVGSHAAAPSPSRKEAEMKKKEAQGKKNAGPRLQILEADVGFRSHTRGSNQVGMTPPYP